MISLCAISPLYQVYQHRNKNRLYSSEQMKTASNIVDGIDKKKINRPIVDVVVIVDDDLVVVDISVVVGWRSTDAVHRSNIGGDAFVYFCGIVGVRRHIHAHI